MVAKNNKHLTVPAGFILKYSIHCSFLAKGGDKAYNS